MTFVGPQHVGEEDGAHCVSTLPVNLMLCAGQLIGVFSCQLAGPECLLICLFVCEPWMNQFWGSMRVKSNDN